MMAFSSKMWVLVVAQVLGTAFAADVADAKQAAKHRDLSESPAGKRKRPAAFVALAGAMKRFKDEKQEQNGVGKGESDPSGPKISDLYHAVKRPGSAHQNQITSQNEVVIRPTASSKKAKGQEGSLMPSSPKKSTKNEQAAAAIASLPKINSMLLTTESTNKQEFHEKLKFVSLSKRKVDANGKTENPKSALTIPAQTLVDVGRILDTQLRIERALEWPRKQQETDKQKETRLASEIKLELAEVGAPRGHGDRMVCQTKEETTIYKYDDTAAAAPLPGQRLRTIHFACGETLGTVLVDVDARSLTTPTLVATLEDLAVKPEADKMGLGRKLVREVEEYVKKLAQEILRSKKGETNMDVELRLSILAKINQDFSSVTSGRTGAGAADMVPASSRNASPGAARRNIRGSSRSCGPLQEEDEKLQAVVENSKKLYGVYMWLGFIPTSAKPEAITYSQDGPPDQLYNRLQQHPVNYLKKVGLLWFVKKWKVGVSGKTTPIQTHVPDYYPIDKSGRRAPVGETSTGREKMFSHGEELRNTHAE